MREIAKRKKKVTTCPGLPTLNLVEPFSFITMSFQKKKMYLIWAMQCRYKYLDCYVKNILKTVCSTLIWENFGIRKINLICF